LSAFEYDTTNVRSVGPRGCISIAGDLFYVGTAFAGERVALKPTTDESRWDVYFCHERVATIDRRSPVWVRVRN
jgi:hypothetical protein